MEPVSQDQLAPIETKTPSKLFNLEELIQLRREIHKFPEKALEEFETCKRIINYLTKFGFNESKSDEHLSFRICAETGIRCTIIGKGPAVGSPLCIMIRADIDALPTPETNDSLEYKSQNPGVGHLCGHDGHIAMMLGGIALILENLESLPSNRTVRVLFQPAEEARGGAKFCIDDGILEGVDEVYGIHNVPHIKAGNIGVCPGPIMAQMAIISIKINGKGGHGSDMKGTINPIPVGFDFYERFLNEIGAMMKQYNDFKCTIPFMNGGNAINVVPDLVEVRGSIRFFNSKRKDEVVAKIQSILDEMEAKYKCQTTLKITGLGQCPTVNTKGAAEMVMKAGKELFGEERSSNEGTPIYASEDFGLFLEKKPGAFFFLGTHESGEPGVLHTSSYNFNDNVLESGARMWLALVKKRLNHEPVSLE